MKAQLEEGMQIGQRRFRALIFVGAIGMQAVSAAASRRVVDW
jgi:hypothetical protein